MAAVAAITYGLLMTGAASFGYRQGIMRRRAFAFMMLGGILLCSGALMHSSQLAGSLWLAAGGLVCISVAALAQGMPHPRWSHHILRGVIALGLLLWLHNN